MAYRAGHPTAEPERLGGELVQIDGAPATLFHTEDPLSSDGPELWWATGP